MAFPIQIVNTFAGQNWLITPAALAFGDVPPQTKHDQKWLLTLSGVAMIPPLLPDEGGLRGNSTNDWLRETLILRPMVADPMHHAIAIHAIPAPPGTEGNEYSLAFQVEQEAPYASISAIYNKGQSINSGFAVDVWRPNHYGAGTDAFSHQPVGKLFSGLRVDVSVRDTDAFLQRVGYNITLAGKIIFVSTPETLFRSNFDTTPVGQPPSAAQEVGTAHLGGTPGSVTVIASPVATQGKWINLIERSGHFTAEFQGLFSHNAGKGIYNFYATLFIPSGTAQSPSGASINFEGGGQQFLHLDFMENNRVRIDDDENTEFGTFPRGQAFTVQVTLNITGASSTAHIYLSKSGASGEKDYTIVVPSIFALQFNAVWVWQGTQWTGGFDATNIVVTRERN